MSGERPPSPGLIPNPFIKRRNLEWTLDSTSTSQPPTTADIESGSAIVDDHLSHFENHLSKHIRTPSPLSIPSYASLYAVSAGSPEGAHFVIHQHDHPIDGTHYDLRLQINEISSASWAIMYGLPGDPNSVRLNRNATETRIHHLWDRKIRIRLHGSRLPDPYVLNLRLTRSEDVAGRVRSGRKPRTRRRRGAQMQPETSDEDESDGNESEDVPASVDTDVITENLSAMEREIRELEDEEVRRTNAYPGASNTIGSVHQRRWYLSLDRPACGFVDKRTKGRSRWESHDPTDTEHKETKNGRLSYPFYVRGSDHERSVVTGRRGADILKDEGVKFTQRQGWKPVLN
ncbi:hypothetical protein NW762_000135 [Fusarium torreyae]|uniref:DNA ligase D 3'-phosphoesterase domain-containing protein n=1 Tax=Fusarium torreyae TaxID=1237075 RepID=A0A9W8SHC6_9HYPO|nr:hypothetical protein NW762_000135 [Fusarium torreyae]